MKTIALFGGSFDPPHIGHVAVVEALEKLKYVDKVVVMPTFLNPFKSTSCASAELRFEWLMEIFKDFKKVEINKFEIDEKRPVPSIESVKRLLETNKKIYLVIGADNLSSLEDWYCYDELKEMVTFIVATRDNVRIDENFIKLEVDKKISSSQIRQNADALKATTECFKRIKKFYKEKNEK